MKFFLFCLLYTLLQLLCVAAAAFLNMPDDLAVLAYTVLPLVILYLACQVAPIEKILDRLTR